MGRSSTESIGRPDPRPGPQWQPVTAQGSLDRVGCIQLANPTLVLFPPLFGGLNTVPFKTWLRRISFTWYRPTNHLVGCGLLLQSNEPSFVLTRQAQSRQAPFHFSRTHWRPRRLLEAWPVSAKRAFYPFAAVFRSGFDQVYFILWASSVSERCLACCWKGRGVSYK